MGWDESVDEFLTKGLYSTLTNVNFDAGDLIQLGLDAGEANLKVMKILKENKAYFSIIKYENMPFYKLKEIGYYKAKRYR